MKTGAANIPALLRRCRHQAEALGNLTLAQRWCEQAMAGADAEGRYHLRTFLAWLQARSARRAARAAAGPRVGVVQLSLMDPDGSGQAFLATLQAVEQAPVAQPRWGAGFARALEQGEAVALDLLLRAGLPSAAPANRPILRFRGPPGLELMRVDGASAGAAAALALVSAWTGLPVPREVVVAGTVGAGGEVLPCQEIQAKVSCAVRELGAAARVLVPPRTELSGARPVSSVAELVAEVLGELPAGSGAVDIEGTVALGEHLYAKAGRPAAASAALTVALDAIHHQRALGDDARHLRREELTCLWRLGSIRTHQGDVTAALALLHEGRALAEQLWDEQEVEPADYFGLAGTLAVLLRDTLRHGEAEALLLRTLDEQRSLRQTRRAQARTLGNLGELWTILGEHARAEQALTEALAMVEHSYPDEVPRELCYLGNLELSRGAPDAALARYDQGLSHNLAVQYGALENEAFLRHGRARALLQLGRPEEAEQEADRVLALMPAQRPYPRQLSLQVRGVARLESKDMDAGYHDLREAADTTHVHGALLRFGVATALAVLSDRLLQAGQRTEAVQAAADFVALAAELLDAHHDPGWSTHMLQLLEGQGADTETLAAALSRAAALFPYR